MVHTMTEQQFDTFMEANGYGIISEEDDRAYVADADGAIVAIYWRSPYSYIETFDDNVGFVESDPMDITKWNKDQWKDSVVGVALTFFIIAATFFVIAVFGGQY